jgi:hypothetical protein
MKKYLPLFEYFNNIPAEKKEVTIRLLDIEKILGAALPHSASEYVEWWANQDYGSQAPSWLEAGFLVDHVDMRLGVITFVRGAKRTARRISPNNHDKKRIRGNKDPTPASYLLDLGFEATSEWKLSSGRLALVGATPENPGVYAFVANGYVNYIGVATRRLKNRIKLYANPGKSQATNLRINPLIRECINSGGSVRVLTVCPGTVVWNGIDIDVTSSLELALIRQIQPQWNISGIS